MSAFAYLEPSQVRKPTVPRLFLDNAGIDPELTWYNESPGSQVAVYVFSAMCDLSNLLQRIVAYSARCMADLNTELGIGTRTEFYQALREWSRNCQPYCGVRSISPPAQAS
jgi:hypothetical protein